MEIQWEAEKCVVISMISTVFKDAKVLGLPVTWRLHGNHRVMFVLAGLGLRPRLAASLSP